IRVTATSIAAAAIEQGDVVFVMEDAPGRSLPRNPHRLTGHDWIYAVRPHIEVDDLVPVLRLIEGTIRPEARSRLELEIDRLIPLRAATFELGRCAAAAAIAPDKELVAATPVTGQVGLAVGQTRCRCVGIEDRQLLMCPVHRPPPA